MSRWQEKYDSIQGSAEWKALLQHARSADFSVIENSDYRDEAHRFKKIAVYTSELLKALDPELMPMNQLDVVNNNFASCISYIPQDQNISAQASHYSQLNNLLDANLAIISIYIKNNRQSAQAAEKAFKEYATSIEAALKVADETRGEIENIKEDLDRFRTYILGEEPDDFQPEEDDTSLYQAFENLYEELAEKSKEISDFHTRLTKDSSEDDGASMISEAKSLMKEIKSISQNVEQNRKILEDHLASLENPVKEITTFFDYVFGKKDAKGNYQGGLRNELRQRQQALAEFEQKQQETFATLNSQIEGLLPGATNAGLASSFCDLKEEKQASAKRYEQAFLFFVAVLFGLTCFSFVPYFFKSTTWEILAQSLLYKLPIIAPVLWLAIVSSKRRSENNRLQEEYAHKEALAISYESYKKQIDALGDQSELLGKLLARTIDTIAKNPSDTLDKSHEGDSPPIVDAAMNAVKSGNTQP